MCAYVCVFSLEGFERYFSPLTMEGEKVLDCCISPVFISVQSGR